MVTSTRSAVAGNENMPEYMKTVMTQFNQAIATINGRIDHVLIQHQWFTDEITKLKGGEGSSNRHGSSQLTRFTKVEFPRFDGSDVKEWLYRCRQFFEIDNLEDEEKIRIVSIHLYKKALTWHQQFIKLNGQVDWEVYEQAILKRFGTTIEDPMAELKNLRQTGSIDSYYEEFEALLNKVELTVKQAVSLFLGGLQKEIELTVRMFKPKTLEEAYGLSKFQEDTIAISKKRYNAILPTPRNNTSYGVKHMQYGSTSANTVTLPPTNTHLALTNTPHSSTFKANDQNVTKKRLSQKEYEEKRLKKLVLLL
ncbi:uncharacterized protein [Rutidosis leptorrhynchoides]|uniref:uncharacterized protein n=1 Tax=Rutidosis leptorrhynchoides TaxID=125765 RepID=UPI003A99CF4E